MIRAAVLGFLVGAAVTVAAAVGVALLGEADRDVSEPMVEWKCPDCNFGCGGDAWWVDQQAAEHRAEGCGRWVL